MTCILPSASILARRDLLRRYDAAHGAKELGLCEYFKEYSQKGAWHDCPLPSDYKGD